MIVFFKERQSIILPIHLMQRFFLSEQLKGDRKVFHSLAFESQTLSVEERVSIVRLFLFLLLLLLLLPSSVVDQDFYIDLHRQSL